MLRTTLFKINVAGRICDQVVYTIGSNPQNVQNVRWRHIRRPRELGPSKSKRFFVPPRRKEDPEERAELHRLNKNYKTVMRSLFEFFREESRLKKEAVSEITQVTKDDEDFEQMTKINNEWNAKCLADREARLEQTIKERKEHILLRLIQKEEQEKERVEKVDELIRTEKEESKHYILPENIDEAIEHALANPVDFNYAIDVKGNIYHGRESECIPPTKKNEDPTEAFQ